MNFGLGLKRLNAVFWGLIGLVCLFEASKSIIHGSPTDGFAMLGLVFAAWIASKLCLWIIEGFWGK